MRFCILLSPSEDKVISNQSCNNEIKEIDFIESLWGGAALYNHRKDLVRQYLHYIKMILDDRDKTMLDNIYGSKNFNSRNEYELNIAYRLYPLKKAICRYNGVAFNGLNYETLSKDSQSYIDHNVLIFSNLFGVIRALDSIPFYKLKQNTKAHNLTLKDVYKPFITPLDDYMKNKEYVIDLRAGVYTKIFAPKQTYCFFEFQKGGKTISHYSKLYRGRILRLLAGELNNFSLSECIDFLCSLQDAYIKFSKLQEIKNQMLFTYEIKDAP